MLGLPTQSSNGDGERGVATAAAGSAAAVRGSAATTQGGATAKEERW